MSTKKGSRKLGIAVLFGALIVVVWVLTTAAQLAAAESISLWQAMRRLHPAGYVLAVSAPLLACMLFGQGRQKSKTGLVTALQKRLRSLSPIGQRPIGAKEADYIGI